MEGINLSEMVYSLDDVDFQGGEISNYRNISTITHQVFALILAIFYIKAKRGVDSNFYYCRIIRGNINFSNMLSTQGVE
jgi:hypothetical protein